jgi:hypothetical protein
MIGSHAKNVAPSSVAMGASQKNTAGSAKRGVQPALHDAHIDMA